MAEDATHPVRQLILVQRVAETHEQLTRLVDKLDSNTLGEDAIAGLKRLCVEAESHVGDLERSTYKLLD
jgi:hypothetical protein